MEENDHEDGMKKYNNTHLAIFAASHRPIIIAINSREEKIKFKKKLNFKKIEVQKNF